MFIDTFDANDRPTASTETAGTSVTTTSFAYNQMQLVGKSTESNGVVLGGWSYAWDAAGRLAVVSESDANGLTSRTTYGNDPTGIRISATTESQFTRAVAASTARTEFLVDAENFTGYQQVLRETHTDGGGTLQRTVDYTFGHDEISQTTVDFTNGQPGEPVTLTFAHDGHGSVRALFDAAGAIATITGVRQLFSYDAYGNSVGFTPTQAATTLLYSGEQFDQRAQMQYLRARYYDANAGRFAGLDPFAGNAQNPQSYNKYLYTHADPVQYVDPTGEAITGALAKILQKIASKPLGRFGAGAALLIMAKMLIGTAVSYRLGEQYILETGANRDNVFINRQVVRKDDDNLNQEWDWSDALFDVFSRKPDIYDNTPGNRQLYEIKPEAEYTQGLIDLRANEIQLHLIRGADVRRGTWNPQALSYTLAAGTYGIPMPIQFTARLAEPWLILYQRNEYEMQLLQALLTVEVGYELLRHGFFRPMVGVVVGGGHTGVGAASVNPMMRF